MNREELRIGNLIYCDKLQSYGDRVATITSLSQKVAHWKIGNRHSGTHYEHCKPIPLTHEILQNFGFKEENDNISPYWKIVINRTEAISIEDDWSFGLNASDELSKQGYASNPGLCQYLHQLQNLYFALTGTELVYNPIV